MSSTLAALRKSPQPAPARFLAAHPGCWIQYFDDTPARDASKALAARRFDPATARRKQGDACAVCFSLQAFGPTRTKEGLLTFRNLGVDVDLVPAADRGLLTAAEIDRRKEEYLAAHLFAFPLRPHWLTETRHGFHVIFRVMPVRGDSAVRAAEAINRRLVRALHGDEHAALLTQVLRVPGTFQFKDPARPFLCRLLVDDAAAIEPYGLDTVQSVLDALGVFEADERRPAGGAPSATAAPTSDWSRRWRERLAGATEGRRNATAASVVGGILARLPEEFWETAGWGGLKEWNARNAVPLRDRELRSVYESIARRERAKRQSAAGARAGADAWTGGRVRVTIRTEGNQPQTHQIEIEKSPHGREDPAAVNGADPDPPPSPPSC